MKHLTYVSIMLSGALAVGACSPGDDAPPAEPTAAAPPAAAAPAPAAPLPGPTASVDQGLCTRDELQKIVDLYIAAQTSGDTSAMPLAAGLGYQENMAAADINAGIVRKPFKIDFHRSLLDVYSCQTFTEVIITDPANPHVLGTRMRLNGDKIAELEVLWTTTGYWLFNANAYLQYSSAEDWGTIPADKRDSRGTLVAAANSYLDAFLEQEMDKVPWGYPCQRIEGGAYTGRGGPDDTCSVGVPANVNIANRRYVVDETIGSVVVFCTFGAGSPNGGSGAPDTHLFRLEGGKLRYVHTLTHLLQANFRGGGGGGGGARGGGGPRGGGPAAPAGGAPPQAPPQ